MSKKLNEAVVPEEYTHTATYSAIVNNTDNVRSAETTDTIQTDNGTLATGNTPLEDVINAPEKHYASERKI